MPVHSPSDPQESPSSSRSQKSSQQYRATPHLRHQGNFSITPGESVVLREAVIVIVIVIVNELTGFSSTITITITIT